MRLRPIAFINIAAALLFAGALVSTVAQTAPVEASPAPAAAPADSTASPAAPATATNALLLGYLYRPYTAHAGFVKLTYLW